MHMARISEIDDSRLFFWSLCHQFVWEGIGHWILRQVIWSIVFDTLHPLGSEIVSHDAALKSLEKWILDLI